MKGIERRAQRVIASAQMDTIDSFEYAICAVGTQWGPDPDVAEVAFHCAHGYGIVYIPTKVWLRFKEKTARAVRRAVALDHQRRGLVSDRREHWMVVAL